MTESEAPDTGVRVLIVDDNPINLKVLLEVLEAGGHTVLAATGGTKALEIAAQAHPRVVLLDVQMPEMDGYQVCRRLKGDPETAGIPVILMTAADREETIRAGGEVGAEGYLPKPFRQEDVLACVAAHTTG